MASAAEEPQPPPALPSGETTALLPEGQVPAVAPLARVLAPASVPAASAAPRPGDPATATVSSATLAPGAADAMRDEEIARTRLFIRMGWLLSVVSAATVLVIDTPPALAAAFITGLAAGMVISFFYHRAFAQPRNYTERRLMTLAIICITNGSLAVLIYGAYTAAPLMIVIGIHFVARTEAERIARWIFATAVIAYTATAAAIAGGVIDDPGAFASAADIGRTTYAVGALFVLATFWLAYYTARQLRAASLAAIEDLQGATRLASQRAAMMAELLGDLERALRAGPGRHSDQVVGPFRLGAVLGRGAMGEVYEACDVVTGEPVAVKLLRPGMAGDPAQRARFARELVVGRRIDSPHVVRIRGGSAEPPTGAATGATADAPRDDLAALSAALPYVAMERLRGATLAELLRREPRLPGDALVALGRQIGAAIDAAAAAGVVHRDLKPHNLFRCDDGTWKVLDFGVAQLASDPDGDRSVIGTPHYMAPEQAQGRRVDRRADLYALGAIAYRCATGRHPFDAPDPAVLLYALVHRMPVRPSALAPLHADFDRFCAVALAKAPGDRFASGAELARALEAALRGGLDRPTRELADALVRGKTWERRNSGPPL